MNREAFKKRQEELAKKGAENEKAGDSASSPSFIDYRDGYRMLASVTLFMSIFTFAFMILAFVFFLSEEPQKSYATTTEGAVHEIYPIKITN